MSAGFPLDDLGLLAPGATPAEANAYLNAALIGARCFSGGAFFGWSLSWSITAPLLLTALAYGAGTIRLWRRAGVGRGARPWQVAAFAFGWATIVAALVSPLHERAAASSPPT